ILEGGALLRQARAEQSLSLRELGERAAVSAATLSQLENGRTPLFRDRALVLAAALGVDPSRLGVAEAAQTQLGFVGTRPGDWRSFAPLELDIALRAALQCFTETGYHGASVRDIARRA